jgi:hypothetical protein
VASTHCLVWRSIDAVTEGSGQSIMTAKPSRAEQHSVIAAMFSDTSFCLFQGPLLVSSILFTHATGCELCFPRAVQDPKCKHFLFDYSAHVLDTECYSFQKLIDSSIKCFVHDLCAARQYQKCNGASQAACHTASEPSFQ